MVTDMSMLSAQCDELRERAKTLRQGRWSDGADDARLMEDAADTIEGLESENAKLRELVRDYIDAPCTTCDCWQDEFRCWNYDGADCGLVARARELGVEVD